MDLTHAFGFDLQVDATGDLALSDGAPLGQERVLRRLLTNPGGYIFHPEYGAGLARFIGQPAARSRIAAVTRSQMLLEQAVARAPAPTVDVVIQPDGTVTETIRYADADTGTSAPVTFRVG